MQSKVTSYMKIDSQSDSECSVGNATRAKYQILPTNDDDSPLAANQFPSTSVTSSSHGLGKSTVTFQNLIKAEGCKSFTDFNKNKELKVSPVIVAKFLESELKSKEVKHCETCACSTRNLIELECIQTKFSESTQTEMTTLSCARCNSLNSPSRTSSPFLMKLKSSDSVISETKSSVSIPSNLEKTPFTPSKKDDLMVNPILGHHRLCEHTKGYNFQPLSKEEEVVKAKEAVKDNMPRHRESVDNKSTVDDKSVSGIQTVLSHGPGNGSNASIWSKTSSKEGAKLFESFNRNLIKTIRVSMVA